MFNHWVVGYCKCYEVLNEANIKIIYKCLTKNYVWFWFEKIKTLMFLRIMVLTDYITEDDTVLYWFCHVCDSPFWNLWKLSTGPRYNCSIKRSRYLEQCGHCLLQGSEADLETISIVPTKVGSGKYGFIAHIYGGWHSSCPLDG